MSCLRIISFITNEHIIYLAQVTLHLSYAKLHQSVLQLIKPFASCIVSVQCHSDKNNRISKRDFLTVDTIDHELCFHVNKNT